MDGFTEKFDGGLNNADPPQMLKTGELTLTLNACYRNTQATINHAPIMVTDSTVTAGHDPVRGLAALTYKDGTKFLLAVTSPQATPTVYTLSFGDVVTDPITWSTTGLTSFSWFGYSKAIVPVQYGDTFYLFTGAGTSNTVLEAPTAGPVMGTLREMGMKPVTIAPGVKVITTGGTTGTWAATGDTVPIYYEYWTTEVYKVGEDVILESSTEDTATTTAYITGISSTVEITRGLPGSTNTSTENTRATHWRVYRSVTKEAAGDIAFPNGTLISVDIPIATLQFIDGSTTSSSFASGTSAAAPYGTVTNVNNLYGAGDATFDLQTKPVAYVAGFPTTNVVDPVTGIEITVVISHVYAHGTTTPSTFANSVVGCRGILQAETAGPTYTTYPPGSVTGAGVSGAATGGYLRYVSGSDTYPKTLTFGGQNEMWGRTSWPLAEVVASKLRFYLSFVDNLGVGSRDVLVTDVQARFYYANGDSTLVNSDFPAVDLTVAGVSSSAGQNFPPAVASTATIFNDTMITNDISNPTLIRWSVPGQIEYFPEEYFMPVETPDSAPVTCIRAYGGICIIGTKTSLWRLNYVPTVDDVRFVKGPALTLIDPNNGIIGPLAAAEYIDHNGRAALSFLSLRGLRGTDGFSTRLLTDNLNWSQLLKVGESSAILGTPEYDSTCLVNNPDNEELILCIPASPFNSAVLSTPTDAGTTLNVSSHGYNAVVYTILFHFSYAARHINDQGELKVGGPMLSGNFGVTGSQTVGAGQTWPQCLALFKNNALLVGSTTAIYAGYAGSLLGSPIGTYSQGQVMRYTPYHLVIGAYTTWAFNPSMQVQTRPIFGGDYGGEWRIKEVYLGPTIADSGNITLRSWNQGADPASSTTTVKAITGNNAALTKIIFDRRLQGAQFRIDMAGGATNTPSDIFGLGFATILAENFEKEDR